MKDQAGQVLTFGFGITVAMWAVGYLSRLPGIALPSSIVFALMVACFAGGTFLAGSVTRNGWRTGMAAGLLSGVLNLLILGSVLATDKPNALIPSAPVYVMGFIGGALIVGAITGEIGFRLAPSKMVGINWASCFAGVAATAVMLLVAVGGLVTSKQAGLAVVDWPNSFGYNMFLYPLARMTGGIYYEHAHRLIGSLVGLTVLTLAIYLWTVEERRWVKVLVLGVFCAVILQGILGGLRVTGHFTWSQDPADTAPNIVYAVIHGVIGQTILGALVALTAFTTTKWKSLEPAADRTGASTDRMLGVVLVVVLVIQLIVGAILRHIVNGLPLHITLAVFALAATIAFGMRTWFLYSDIPLLSRLGKTLVGVAVVQLALGIASLIVTGGATSARQNVPATEAIITTAHQIVGAVLLATAVILMVWCWRLLTNSAEGVVQSALKNGQA